MPETTSGVYVILCRENGRRYVGSSNDIWRRFREHRNELRLGEHHSALMQADWIAHGEEAFSFFTVMTVADDKARFAAEQVILDACDAVATGYNTAPNTYCLIGTKRTPEQCENLRASWTPERRKKISDTHSGARNLFSRLSDEDAEVIRRRLAAGERGVVLAREYGVSQAAISAIRRGKVRREGFDPAQIVDHHGVNNATLDEGQVREIRRRLAAGETGKALAAAFNVSGPTISLIRNGRIWKHVTLDDKPDAPLTLF